MSIKVAKSAGFCFGVENAVKIAKSNAPNAVTLGEIIHNKGVVEELREIGVPPIESLDEYNNGIVIIRSHGVPRSVIDYMDKRGIPYVDATCPFVAKIHRLVDRESKKGNEIIIIGEPTHHEVIGTNGWCDNRAIVVSDISDFANNNDNDTSGKIVLDPSKSYSVVAQTTFSYEKYNKITDFIKKQVKTVVFFNTICYTTKERQREADILASESDMMLVVGGRHSSNTLKLYDICKAKCERTYLIESIADIKSVVANKKYRLGITAGASTPRELIEEVVTTMAEMLDEKVAKAGNEEIITMEDVMNSQEGELTLYKKGQEKIVRVLSANEEGVDVDFGGKKDGFIPKEEAVADGEEYDPNNFKAGDELKAIVINTGNKEAVIFSKKASDKKIKELKECEEILKGSEFQATIEKAVPGGLLSKMGPYTIFVPGSQIKMGYARDLEKYVGKTLRLRMIPAKPSKEGEEEQPARINGKRIVASQRVILEEEKQAREEKFWAEVVQGAVVKGKVKRFTSFGAFVNVNGKDCLAHISDLSWYKIDSPAEVLEINKTYDFVVLKTCRENDQVSLGFKQLQKKPYEVAFEELPVGTVIKGVVERVFPYGAFVSIKKGVDGLIPVSEISHEWVKNATEKFQPGDEVEAVIINFEGNKITLSVKALTPAPEVVEDVENISDEELQEHNERKARANARRFENKPATRKPRAKKTEVVDDTPKSWSTDSSSATIGDLFKGFDFDFSDENSDNE